MRPAHVSPCEQAVIAITFAGAEYLKHGDRDGFLTTLSEFETQALRDVHLDNRDAAHVMASVDAWIRLIQFQEGNDGKRVEGTTPG